MQLANLSDLQTEKLKTLQTKTKVCNRCPLRATCNQVVPGLGPADAKLMLIGEGPGSDEDILGEPFVGLCGQLLTKLLTEAGLSREGIYITNTVKCRPP